MITCGSDMTYIWITEKQRLLHIKYPILKNKEAR